jgi:hypothetical protein
LVVYRSAITADQSRVQSGPPSAGCHDLPVAQSVLRRLAGARRLLSRTAARALGAAVLVTSGLVIFTSSPAFADVASVTTISPTSGPTAGGTVVAVTGSDFTEATGVYFGATPAVSYLFEDDGDLTATSPPGSGTVDVTVTTPDGSSPTSAADQFTYATDPAVGGVSPPTGQTAGGTLVDISGVGFEGATAVAFGGVAATSFTVVSDSEIEATSPAGDGTVDVTVTTGDGTSATGSDDQFSFDTTPTVASLSADTGPTAGGSALVITGSGFEGATAVEFGSTPAEVFDVVSDSTIDATSPTGIGSVDVTVTTGDGTSATGAGDIFTYDTTPAVTSVSPDTGPTAGGTAVIIAGSGLLGTTAVEFGSTPASAFSIVSDSEIEATSPAGSGDVDVTVTTGDGTSPTAAGDEFAFFTVPVVGSVAPSSGATAGGTTVTITGSGFEGATAVIFGGFAPASFRVLTDNTIVATSPPGFGAVDVTVASGDGQSHPAAGGVFTFDTVPAITSFSPAVGPSAGGTVVTIEGSGFEGTSAVHFGTASATAYDVVSDSVVTATAPAGTGSSAVTLTTDDGTTGTGGGALFDYVPPPIVSKISPSSGPSGGGTVVTISGSNLSGATAVHFGSVPARIEPGSSSATSIKVLAPAGAGTADVTVTTPYGTSTASVSFAFTFVLPPAVSRVAPSAGSTGGGTVVILSGSSFGGATAVHFGAALGHIDKVAATSIEVTTPKGSGTVEVTVSTPYGTSQTVKTETFTYVSPPSLTKLTPAFGPTTGGTLVTISGANLAGATAVHFGNVAAHIDKVTPTAIEATSPKGAGTVNITVTTAGGSTAITKNDVYTYTAPFGEGLPPLTRDWTMAAHSSPEKRSHADWRVIPSASPIRVQVTSRARRSRTIAVTKAST